MPRQPALPLPGSPALRSTARRRLLQAVAAGAAASPLASRGQFNRLLKSDPKPILLEDSLDWAATAAEAFGRRPDDGKARKLALSAFQVNFVTATSAGQKIGNSDTTLAYELEAPPPAVFQSLADQARDEFVAALKGRGIEVLPPEALLADEDFARRAAEASRPGVREAGLTRTTGIVAVNASGTVDNWGMLGKVHEMKLADKIGGGVGLVGVRLFVTFATLEAMGWPERAAATTPEGQRVGSGVKGQVGLSVMSDEDNNANASALSLTLPTGNYAMKLHRVLALNQPFARSIEDATTGGDAAVGLLGALLGRASSTRRLRVKPADDYAAQVGKGLSLALRLMAEFMVPR